MLKDAQTLKEKKAPGHHALLRRVKKVLVKPKVEGNFDTGNLPNVSPCKKGMPVSWLGMRKECLFLMLTEIEGFEKLLQAACW